MSPFWFRFNGNRQAAAIRLSRKEDSTPTNNISYIGGAKNSHTVTRPASPGRRHGGGGGKYIESGHDGSAVFPDNRKV